MCYWTFFLHISYGLSWFSYSPDIRYLLFKYTFFLCMLLSFTYLFHSEYLLYSCLNIKELFTRNRRDIWSLSNNNGTGWLNGWVFVYELSGFGFESRCCHLHFFLVLLLYLSTKINKQLAGRLLHFILRN